MKRKMMINCKYCGGNPKIEESAFSHYHPPIKYVVKCRNCEARTEDGSTKEEAIDNWNEQLFVSDTEMLQKPLDVEEMYADGITKLTEAVFREAAEYYIEAVRTDCNEQTNKSKERVRKAERFFYESPFMGAIDADPDAIIKSLKKRALM